ncbi:ABC transporter ATP-binding protein [Dactylosporangium sp. CA-092794]|uniref:ABC transporter ATP-binding protein n=1 Tax=Dactylosporangium sp. CA-092794 TaxID=3239929 RepID=UPI003D8A61D7
MAGDSAVLEARGVSVGYGAIPVVRELDLTVGRGEVVALLGANGAGKTTTLMALAGLLPLSAGAVYLHGKQTTDTLFRRVRRGLSYVPEERGIFRQLTVMENLRLGRGDPARAIELMPPLGALTQRRAGLLSGGEQQMLSLARALAAEPAVLLCDELSLGLAPLIVERLLERISVAAQAGLGVLLVEQQVRSALMVADRAYVLRRGRVVMSGTASELAERLDEIESHYLSGLETADERR